MYHLHSKIDFQVEIIRMIKQAFFAHSLKRNGVRPTI